MVIKNSKKASPQQKQEQPKVVNVFKNEDEEIRRTEFNKRFAEIINQSEREIMW